MNRISNHNENLIIIQQFTDLRLNRGYLIRFATALSVEMNRTVEQAKAILNDSKS